jgi:hypothetical protein
LFSCLLSSTRVCPWSRYFFFFLEVFLPKRSHKTFIYKKQQPSRYDSSQRQNPKNYDLVVTIPGSFTNNTAQMCSQCIDQIKQIQFSFRNDGIQSPKYYFHESSNYTHIYLRTHYIPSLSQAVTLLLVCTPVFLSLWYTVTYKLYLITSALERPIFCTCATGFCVNKGD